MHQGCLLLPIRRALCCSHCHPTPSKATFTLSTQPNLGLMRTRAPLTSPIDTLRAILYSSFLSTCPNHLNTLWSTLPTSLFLLQLFYEPLIQLSIRVTLKHSIWSTFTLLLATLPIPHACLWTVQWRWHNCSLIHTLFKLFPLYTPIFFHCIN